MTEELKPCPFCGGDAEVVQAYVNQSVAKCMNAMCPVEPATLEYDDHKMCIEERNTRASPWIKCEERLPKMCDFPILIRPTAQKSIIYISFIVLILTEAILHTFMNGCQYRRCEDDPARTRREKTLSPFPRA